MSKRLLAVLAAVTLSWLLSGHLCTAALVWEELPSLPDELGFGGPFAGVHNDALIVGGGANFPEGPPWEGGQKVWHDDVFVLEREANGQIKKEWIKVNALPKRIAYAASVATDDGVLIIGGEEDGTPLASVFRLKWDSRARKTSIETLPPLPQPASYLSAGLIDSVVYVVAASRSEGAERLDMKYFWSLDLERLGSDPTTAWQTLQPYPCPARQKAVVATQAVGEDQEYLFLVSGESPRFGTDGAPDLAGFEYLTDAYRYSPIESSWTQLADLPVLPDDRDVPDKQRYSDQRWPVAAGTGIGVGQSHVLLFSGSTGRYLGLPAPERPVFPNYVLAYHTITDTWVRAGEMPLGVVTTSIARWDNRIVIPSGEIRPAVRTNRVQSLKVTGITTEFGAWNYSVLTLYLFGMLAVGGYFALRTKSTDDFFRGGQRVPYWVAGLSIFATMLSSITFVALPAKAYATDWRYYVAQLTIIPIAFVVVHFAIPFFRYIDATSVYEYLEKRFGRLVRLFASLQFVLFQVGRMAIVMYLPALALATITPLSVMECVLLMGTLSIVYCTLGGVEAVVWTDAIQTLVLLGGLVIAIVVVVSHVDGGVPAVLDTAYRDGKLHLADFDVSLSSYATTAVWVIFVGQFFQSLYSYTSDQAVVQRYLTTKSEKDAEKSMWTTAWMGVFGSLLFFLMGSALYVYYKSYPQDLDIGIKSDSIFPLFIATKLPFGIAGLVVAGIFAAAQSTISTSMNSTATAIVTDFCMPLQLSKSDRGYLWLARVATVLLGIAGTAISCWLVVRNESSMIDTFITVIGLFGGAVCGLFMLGIFTRRANSIGSLMGSLTGFGTVWYVMRNTDVNHFLYAMIGTLVTFSVGYLISLFFTAPNFQQLAGLTVYDRVTAPTAQGTKQNERR